MGKNWLGGKDEKEKVVPAESKVETSVAPVVPPAPVVPQATGNRVPGKDVKGAINPPNPVLWKFICGVCHTVHILDEDMTNKRGSVAVTDRKLTLCGARMIEVVCSRCGMATWKVDPGYEGTVVPELRNVCFKKG